MGNLINIANEIYNAYVESIKRKHEYLNMPIPTYPTIVPPGRFWPDGSISIFPPLSTPFPLEESDYLYNLYIEAIGNLQTERFKEVENQKKV